MWRSPKHTISEGQTIGGIAEEQHWTEEQLKKSHEG